MSDLQISVGGVARALTQGYRHSLRDADPERFDDGGHGHRSRLGADIS
jgi:hypothetical protein